MNLVTQYGYSIFIATICLSHIGNSNRLPRFARRNLPSSATNLNSDPSQLQQCPCVRAPNGNQCTSLDSTMVATSLEDALTNFQRPRDFYLETETEDSVDYTDDSDSGYDESENDDSYSDDSDSDEDDEDEEHHSGFPLHFSGAPLHRVFPPPMHKGSPRQGPRLGFGPGRPNLPRSGTGRSNPNGFGATVNTPKHKIDLDPPNLGSKMMCSDSSCKSCANYILKNLEEQTRRKSQFSGQAKVMSELENMQNKWGAKGTGDQCNDLGFHFDDKPAPSAFKASETAAAKAFVKVDETDAKLLWSKIVGQTVDNDVQTGEGAYFIPGLKGRKRRQTESRIVSEKKINSKFEIQYKIDCRKKGAASESNSPYMGLCGTCWEWGMLPSRFYPQYVNMMTCNTNTNCLSGYGECRQRVRNVQVLENVAAEGQAANYKAFSLPVPLCCDCQVKAGTALHNLVTG